MPNSFVYFEKSPSAVFSDGVSNMCGLFRDHNWLLTKETHTEIPDDLAHILTNYGGTSPDFREGIVNAWEQLPPGVGPFLSNSGIKISNGGTMASMLSEKICAPYPPTADDPRFDINQIPGNCINENQVYLAQYYYNDNIKLNIPPINTSVSNLTEEQLRYSLDLTRAVNNFPGLLNKTPDLTNGHWRTVSSDLANEECSHEMGHVTYYAASIGNDPSYNEAYNLDVKALGGPDGARSLNLGYYIQTPETDRGKNEAFAEAFSAATDPNCTRTNYIEHFPHVCAWVREYLGHFDQCQPYTSKILAPIDRGINTTDLGNVTHLSHPFDALSLATMHFDFSPFLRFGLLSTFLIIGYARLGYRRHRTDFHGTPSQFLESLAHRSPEKIKGIFSSAKDITKRAAVRLNPTRAPDLVERKSPFFAQP